MKCLHCRGEMQRGEAPFHVDRQRWRLTLEAIPAWVCRQCGEVYFEETEVEENQDVVRAVESSTDRIGKGPA
jgi:YgiT-type zinc finger domain-containing protein